ncbi:MAG: efflux RND transporter periplasmic adaptor subunit [Alphaproteobacteria bacterium]
MALSRKYLAVLTAAAIGIGGYLYARSSPAPAEVAKDGAESAEAVPVSIAPVMRKSVPVTLPAIGTVVSLSSVAVKSRVDGQIFEQDFKEGQNVHKGDLLFTIDPRPFDAAVRQAEANLARDKAQLEGAKLDLTRYSELAKSGFAAQQKYEESKTAVDSLDGTVKADDAALETARLNQNYTAIRSPLDGRTGSVLIHPGNLVKANDTVSLIVINQVHPINVSFAVPEQYLPEITRRMAEAPLEVQARIADDAEPPMTGQLSFINNAVDTTTGTIMLKALFANDDERLVPGAFVRVKLLLKTLDNVLVVPTAAIQNGQKGSYVYVVGADQTVEVRNVSGLTETGDETAVATGLKDGENVVTDGQLRLRPGVKVVAKQAAPSSETKPSEAKPPASPPPAAQPDSKT